MRAEYLNSPVAKHAAARVSARMPSWAIPCVKTAIITLDALLAIFCFCLAFYLREGQPVFSYGVMSWSSDFAPYAAVLLFVAPVRVLAHFYYDLYRLRGDFSYIDDATNLFKATCFGSLIIIAIAFLYRGGFDYRAFSYARSVFLLDFLLALLSYLLLRFSVRVGQSYFRQHGINLIPTLIVGRGPEASLYIKEIRSRPELGYRVIGLVDRTSPEHPERYEDVPILGDISTLAEIIKEAGANEVVVADKDFSADELVEVMMKVGRRRSIEFRLAPTLINCMPHKTEMDHVGVIPMIRLFREPLSDLSRTTKRLIDITLSATVLLLFSPILLLIVIAIKLDSRGPVFFKQERVGMDGRLFLLFKFRTMYVDNDDAVHREYLKQLITGDASTNFGDTNRPVYKLKSDSRITKVGKLLRKFSLDEFPQLLNVLFGHMSIVGPRPPIRYEVEVYKLWHRRRLDIKPGITGLWQVSGRNRLSFDEMVRLDLYYIENWSLWLDIKIILMTIPTIIKGEDAY
jgi:exopolysaccharide biosynthesis polyprenyl glycosylphosphotransferase